MLYIDSNNFNRKYYSYMNTSSIKNSMSENTNNSKVKNYIVGPVNQYQRTIIKTNDVLILVTLLIITLKLLSLILVATNSDQIRSNNQFLLSYFNEIKKIQNILKGHKDFKKLYNQVEKSKTENIQGSFLNRILCKYEELIIDDLIKFVKPKVFANMFDGALFITDDKNTIDLDEVNSLIQLKYSFKFFEFAFKPITNETEIVIPDDYVYDKLKYEKQRVDYKSV